MFCHFDLKQDVRLKVNKKVILVYSVGCTHDLVEHDYDHTK